MKQITFDFYNIGGIQKIYAIPETSFRRVLEDTTSGNCTLSLIRIDDIIEIYTVDDTLLFTEEQIRNAPGNAYQVSITGIIPKSNPINRKQMLRLENTPLLALFIDNNDFVRLAGTEENRMIFKRKDTTGTMQSRNQIDFEISGTQSNPCYFIDPQSIEQFD